MTRSIFVYFFLCLLTNTSWGQILHPAQWDARIEPSDAGEGQEAEVVFDVKIEDNWYLYSSDFDPDLGPMVTEFQFDEHPGYELIGGIVPISPKEKYDSLWEGNYTYFTKVAQFRQKVKIKSADYQIKGHYTYQVCSDVDGKCIPFDEDFEIGESSQMHEGTIQPEAGDTEEGLWDVFLLALVAGLVALATPCVYPMIPMTVSVFMKQGGSRGKGIAMAAVFGLSIIILFTVIGFVVSLIWGFSALNELSTNWLFNLMLFTVFVLFALSFFGLFEITLPHQVVNKIDEQADRGGYVGVFFMAMTLVVVSFSCTVPIVGTALLTALNDGKIIDGTVAMFGFSLAFAVPFTAFALFPRWLKGLPQSGGWLNSVKVVLGFLELALALKFLSIADLSYHWGILDRDVFLALWIAIFSLLGFYLLGKVRFKSDSPEGPVPVFRMFLSIIVLAFVVYLVPGMFGAPLKGLAGFLPPQGTMEFNLYGATGTTTDKAVWNQECEPPRYTDLLKWPHGLAGYFDYDQALQCAQATNKPIFLDFTGHACVNCREMEARVWSDPQVRKLLDEEFVLLALYVDDKTELPKEEWYKSSYDNKIKRTIGNQNADFQIKRFNNNAQPYYVLLSPSGELLGQPRAYDLSITGFIDFLQNGLTANNKDQVQDFIHL